MKLFSLSLALSLKLSSSVEDEILSMERIFNDFGVLIQSFFGMSFLYVPPTSSSSSSLKSPIVTKFCSRFAVIRESTVFCCSLISNDSIWSKTLLSISL